MKGTDEHEEVECRKHDLQLQQLIPRGELIAVLGCFHDVRLLCEAGQVAINIQNAEKAIRVSHANQTRT